MSPPRWIWMSGFVILLVLTTPVKIPATVHGSLQQRILVSDNSFCQEGCSCNSIYQQVRCEGLGLLSVPNDTVRNNTRVLQLPGNAIQSLTRTTVRTYRQLRFLDLSDNLIWFISDDAFEGLPKLAHLDLSGNRLSWVPVVALSHLKSLRTLILARNNITFLTSESFAGLTKLQNLTLASNGLQAIDPDALIGLNSLRVLNLYSNYMRDIPSGALRDCNRLEELYLSYNSISAFVNESETLGEFDTRSWFEPAEPNKLRVLRLSHNLIDIFSPWCFAGMYNLAELDLSSNYILEIPTDLFQDLEMLETLKLSKNKMLHSIPSEVFRNNVNLVSVKIRNCQLTDLSLNLLSNKTSLQILDLTGNLLSKTDFLSADNMPSLTRLFLGGNSIEHISDNKLIGFSKLQVLGLSANFLTNLPILEGIGALEVLDVSQNRLESLPEHAFGGTALRYIDLSSNALQTLMESTIAPFASPDFEIMLHDNPWACDCHLAWVLDIPYKDDSLSSEILCVWPPRFEGDTFSNGYYEFGRIACAKYPKRKNLYRLIGAWFGVVASVISLFWAVVFHRARRRFRARRPRERFLLFKGQNETNVGSTSTAGHSKVRFKALDSETESLEDDETTV